MRLKGSSSIFLVGPMASGKTTLGKLLAKRLGLSFVDTDHTIEERSGVSVRTIFDVEGEAAFRDRESAVLESLSSQTGLVVATGGGCVLRPENRALLNRRGLVVFLDPDLETQLKRTEGDRKRPLLQNVDRHSFLKQMKQERDPLYREIASVVLAVDNRPGKKMLEVLMRTLTEEQWVTER
jgi:shikimate kinase